MTAFYLKQTLANSRVWSDLEALFQALFQAIFSQQILHF
jgi:hypothetical protein